MPLQLPKENAPAKQDGDASAVKKVDPAQQIEDLRQLAAKGDRDAAFRLGTIYLIGQAVPQDAAKAEEYFKDSATTTVRRCFVAEAYFETALPQRIPSATRWALAADSSCGYLELGRWYSTVPMGPDTAKEVEALRKGLTAKDDGFRRSIQSMLGELLLGDSSSIVIEATPEEKVAWIGEAARRRLGSAESGIAGVYTQHTEDADARPEALTWIANSARYGTPYALATLGGAAMQRELSELSFLEGLALYDLGTRQDLLAAVGEELELKQLQPEQREELLNADAAWERVAREAGGYYRKGDPLRFAEPVDVDALTRAATPQDPDAELRLAYLHESKGELSAAEALYREVWRDGAAQRWFQAAEEKSKAGKWKLAAQLYRNAADVGSRQACVMLSRIDAEGLVGDKDITAAYLWLLLSESRDAKLLADRKRALGADQVKTAELAQAQWVLSHKDYWKGDLAVAQALVDKDQAAKSRYVVTPGKPPMSNTELRKKADAGDANAAYQFVINLLRGDTGMEADAAMVDRYATIGATGSYEKANIASWYSDSPLFDRPTQLKYAEKWARAAGGSQGFYTLAKAYNGKSDGVVQTEDEKKAVAFWRLAVDGGDERWARLSRMELGYRVDKGWSSGDKKLDAAWAHELALEMMGKEFYQIAGEYSYGRELKHNPQTYLLLAERAAIYNIDNAQGQLAEGIQNGEWKRSDEIDAYVWMKLRAVKQDTGGEKQVAVAEENPDLKRKIEDRYVLLLKTRSESGAFYPQRDLYLEMPVPELEQRAKQQDPEAELRLAAILEKDGSDASLTRALALYRTIWISAGQQVRLAWGRRLMEGSDGVIRDDVGAQKWLWDAANAGSHEACRLLSIIYAEGRGVKADPAAAETWRELAGDPAPPQGQLTPELKSVVHAKVAEWTGNHPSW